MSSGLTHCRIPNEGSGPVGNCSMPWLSRSVFRSFHLHPHGHLLAHTSEASHMCEGRRAAIKLSLFTRVRGREILGSSSVRGSRWVRPYPITVLWEDASSTRQPLPLRNR